MTEVNIRDLLDPELRPALEAFELPPLDPENLATMRGSFAEAGWLELSDAVERSERLVPGEPPLPLRVHRAPGTAAGAPAVLTIHGGGFVIGSYDMDNSVLDRWCRALGVVGVSVEYRLAPETPYPGPLEDCYAALRWTHGHAEELGIDPDHIGVFGISAGGGLAAGLALLARDRGEIPVAFQILESPMLDDRELNPSIQQDGLYVWSREANIFGWRSYLGDLFGAKDVPIYAAPARATKLGGLPPSFVSVGAIDGFRDEDVDYALRLNQAGVPCELHVYEGLPHAYEMVPDARAVKLAARDVEDWLARQLRRCAAEPGPH